MCVPENSCTPHTLCNFVFWGRVHTQMWKAKLWNSVEDDIGEYLHGFGVGKDLFYKTLKLTTIKDNCKGKNDKFDY